ncbi:hypothetical protein LX16_1076 [Stackebrandtia albiflava]|uniref:Uncharacterized protein n=1 Tax=Stackebrandtia albiflava TaxID=406432 RepID=A0A562VBW0_9ACTN|nr:hypothetical protein [Stackebrandtia albiflava]TWJ15373.1 hypothetical protein LX16_1076 [Stackebrandtia albiflava]
MFTLATRLGDAMLAKLAPRTEASAGCPTESWYDYRCTGARLYRRRCTTSSNCTTSCGIWSYISQCP